MTRIGQWFESCTIDLVASPIFLISPDFYKLMQSFPNSPLLLDVVNLSAVKFPDPFPHSPLRKKWLTIIVIDNHQDQVNAFGWKYSRITYQKSVPPEYFLLYLKSGYPYPTAIFQLPFKLKVLIGHPSSPILATTCIPSQSYLTLESSTLPEFDSIWNSCNGNLQNKPVTVERFGGVTHQKRREDCGYNSHHAEQCNILCLAERHNFTFATTRFDKSVHLFHIYETFQSSLEPYFLHDHFSDADYFPGIRIPFNFYVIIPKPKSLKGFKALIEPFPIETWVSVLLTCAVIGLLIYGAECSHEHHLLHVGSLLQDFWVVYSALLLQSSSRVGPLSGKWGVKAIWIVGWFLLCAIIMTSLYQGELATTMTTAVFPFIPLTLEDIANTGISVITVGKWYGSNLNGHIDVIKSLGIYAPRVTDNLQKIKNRSLLASSEPHKVGLEIIKAGKLYLYPDRKEVNLKGKIFAVMDADMKTRYVVDGVMLSHDLIVYNAREDLHFNEDFLYAWRRNFFTKIYRRSWFALIEGGLDNRFIYLDLLSEARRRKDQFGNHKTEHFLGVLFNGRNRKKDKKDEFSKISQESMLPCYYFFLFLLSLTIVTFVGEIYLKLNNRTSPFQLDNQKMGNLRKCNNFRPLFKKNLAKKQILK
ncbi:DNA ligase B [Folsomia candida]|uniref:DNA ligase B n=1 Tax=Folsomia candida TaxID=158441 RepID=A0A226CYH5_FOLCA|nr:DNA ligase B [Folsomia candida]